jgi:hypothetical protein
VSEFTADRSVHRVGCLVTSWEDMMAKQAPDTTALDHREAVRLAWKSIHLPIGSIFIGTLLLAATLSAVSTVWGYGPANPIPY